MLTVSQLSLTHRILRRLVRVGSTPVLEVTVTYPVLSSDALSPAAVARFNEGYRTVAEAFLLWALGEPAEEATEAFAVAGPRAPYTFDRRLVDGRMTASVLAAPGGSPDDPPVRRIRVERRITLGSRRTSAAQRGSIGREMWTLPDLFLLSPRRKNE